MAALVDTNVLVYRFDGRFPDKQRTATGILRAGIAEGSVYLPHQAIVEFVAAVTRRPSGADPILDPDDARREAEELLAQFDVLYPDEEIIRLALRGAAAYRLSWFDAHMWAYAERFGLAELLSEDFQHGRLYGTVQAVNPFTSGSRGPSALRREELREDRSRAQLRQPGSGPRQTSKRAVPRLR